MTHQEEHRVARSSLEKRLLRVAPYLLEKFGFLTPRMLANALGVTSDSLAEAMKIAGIEVWQIQSQARGYPRVVLEAPDGVVRLQPQEAPSLDDPRVARVLMPSGIYQVSEAEPLEARVGEGKKGRRRPRVLPWEMPDLLATPGAHVSRVDRRAKRRGMPEASYVAAQIKVVEDSICQIAFVAFDKGGSPFFVWDSWVHPGDTRGPLPDEIARHVEGMPSFRVFAARVEAYIRRAPRLVVFGAAEFRGHLCRALQGASLAWPEERPLVCARESVGEWLPHMPDHGLEAVCKHVKIRMSAPGRADAEAEAIGRLYARFERWSTHLPDGPMF